jgi:lipopolysaccharide export LptBFGC system permease protein LptF
MSLPLLLRLRVQESGKKDVRLYLPLFLVWLLLFPLLLVATPFILVAVVLTWRRGHGRTLLVIIPMLVTVIWSLSGLHIQVEKPDNQVLLWIR